MPLDDDDLEELWRTVKGNGHPGLDERMRDVERALWRNPDTGDPGLVATAKTTLEVVQKMERAQAVATARSEAAAQAQARVWRVVAWLIGLLGVAGVGQLVRSLIAG